jgi:hypothetical protein
MLKGVQFLARCLKMFLRLIDYSIHMVFEEIEILFISKTLATA